MMLNWLKGAGSGAAGGGSGGIILPAAVAAREAREARVREARARLAKLLDLPERAAGRPTASRLEREAMVPTLADAYARADVAAFDEWWPVGAVAVYERYGWSLHADMHLAGAEEDALEGASDAAVEEESRGAVYASVTVQRIYRSLCHKWAANGSHAGWRDGEEVQQLILQKLDHQVSRATAFRYLAKEKELWNKGDACALLERVDLVDLINATRSEDKERTLLMPKEEPMGRPHEFQPTWYPALAERCNKLQKLLGFGPHVVQAFAILVYADKMEMEPEMAWVPSIEWCYWFLHKIMDVTPRRITSHASTLTQKEEQEKLHKITLQRLAIKFSEGMKVKHLSGSDEFALHLFSHAKWKWEKKGAKKVESLLAQDRRQITGDIATNSEGTVIAVHCIFDGKTERSLPTRSILNDPMFALYLFSVTDNHWCNHETKCRFMDKIYRWHLEETAKDQGISPQDARGLVNAVHLLDCWPVNLTDKFREYVRVNCPGLDLMYIPAGDTGDKQVNDTDMHKPMKDCQRRECEKWFLRKYHSYLLKNERGETDTATFEGNVAALMSKHVLRQKLPFWLETSVQHLLRPLSGGGNIISNGWQRIYLNFALNPEFLEEALVERERRRVAAVAKAVAEVQVQKKLRIQQSAAKASAAAVKAAQEGGMADASDLSAVAVEAAASAAAAAAAAEQPDADAAHPGDIWDGLEAAKVVEAAEKEYHLAQVPKLRKGGKASKDGKAKKARRADPAARAAGAAVGRAMLGGVSSSEEEGEEEGGGDGGNRGGGGGGGGGVAAKGPRLKELQARCSALGLPKGGNKADLAQRLAKRAAADAAAAAGAAAAAAGGQLGGAGASGGGSEDAGAAAGGAMGRGAGAGAGAASGGGAAAAAAAGAGAGASGAKRGAASALGSDSASSSESESGSSSSGSSSDGEGGAGEEEPRLKAEKEPAVFWLRYVDELTVGKPSAPLKLIRVLAKISEIIATAEECGYKEKLLKWRKVKAEVEAAVSEKEQASYRIVA